MEPFPVRFHGPSASTRRIEEQIERQALIRLPLLIEGERGVGKRRAARAIHGMPLWREKPWISVDGTDEEDKLPDPSIVSSEGAFLVLEEIGVASMKRQNDLWRWLRQIGREAVENGRIRLVATCEGSLGRLVALRRFRNDLYLRLRVATIEMPSLQERREDIPHLVREFLEECTGSGKEEPKTLTAEAMDWVLSFSWPGNVAQLRQELLRAANATSARAIGREHMRSDWVSTTAETEEICVQESSSLRERIEEFEKKEILRILHEVGGVRERAAQALCIDRRTLQRKMRRWKMSAREHSIPNA